MHINNLLHQILDSVFKQIPESKLQWHEIATVETQGQEIVIEYALSR